MQDENAKQLLTKVMGWEDTATIIPVLQKLQLLAEYKYDHYQQFEPGRRFIESLALWLKQFSSESDKTAALQLVLDKLVFFSDAELSHLVRTVYPDVIVQEQIRLVSEEFGILGYKVAEITRHWRFKELRRKSLYLGLSDGARTNELRRASKGAINNEQIWQAYELSDEKASDMIADLRARLKKDSGEHTAIDGYGENARFNLIWLLDDFSASGNTYIRYDTKDKRFKGKLKKIYERLHKGDLVDVANYEVVLLLYIATRKAIDHIQYWSDRYTAENGYKPVQIKILCPLEPEVALAPDISAAQNTLEHLLTDSSYYDKRASDKHIHVGGTDDARLGFADCRLPVVLFHNTPNNSIFLLWGEDYFQPFGLFPRVSRHKEF